MTLANLFEAQSALSSILPKPAKQAKQKKQKTEQNNALVAPVLPGWMSDTPTGRDNPFAAPVAPMPGLAQSVVGGNATEELLRKLRQNQGIMAALGAGETGGVGNSGIMSLLGLR